MKYILTVLIFFFISGCGFKPSIDDPKLSDMQLNLESFLVGDLVAYGQFQDVLGNVSRRFTVNMLGEWDGKNLKLTEDFQYADGTTEQRIWHLKKTGEQAWSGTADGVIGQAEGLESGDTFYWNYTIDLPVPDGTMRVTFDDYMWLISEERMLNKAYMSKFGMPLGEVTIMFEKL
ncbi:MAG: hypothetical protein CML52_03260 [Rhodobacteraceae bacterium]|nr:hypothetical protein [Paracoccaceae bacterium]